MPSNGDWLGALPLTGIDDEVFLALADPSRRLALYYLRDRRRVDVATLADVVTGWSGAGRRGTANRVDRDRVLVALRAQHLPLLSAAGLVDYDEAAGTVEVERFAGSVRTLLDVACAWEGDRDVRE